MIAEVLILGGAYVPVAPTLLSGFLLPKQFTVALGCLVARRPATAPRLRGHFLLVLGAAALSADLMSLLGRNSSTSAGLPGLALFWLCYEAGCGVKNRERAAKTLALSIIGATVAALFLPHFNGRAGGTLGSPPLFSCMAALAPIPGAVALWMAGSRAGTLGAAAGLAYHYLGWRGPAAVVAGAAVLAGAARPEGDAMRLQIWGACLRAFAAKPLLGHGVEGVTDAFALHRGGEWVAGALHVVEDAHCLPLHLLVTGGVVGFCAWANLLSRFKERAVLSSILVYGLFNPVPWTAWCVLAYLEGAGE